MMNKELRKNRHSFHSDNNERDVQFRSRFSNLRRPYSLVNLVSNSKERSSEVYESASVVDEPATPANNSLSLVAAVPRVEDNVKRNKVNKAIVSIVLVEARGLPDPPEDGCNHTVYCKIRLGEETIKSKAVQVNRHIEWRERMKIQLNKDHVLRISLWDKGKRRNFMGSCIIDLSYLELERTHEIWQQLDDGYGSLHLSVTICSVTNDDVAPNTNRDVVHNNEKYAFYNLNTNWKVVGELHVKLIAGKGFSGKPNAYCVLELDNERVQTPASRGTELTWNKSYVFNVHDISSLLDLKVCDNSLVNALFSDTLGKISIPLLRIRNGETRWYALKDRTKKNIAKGNCPRVLLELSVFWNPVKASIKLFQPKEVKHIKKTPKYDITLVYKNLEFVRDTFLLLMVINDAYKQAFEWDSQDLSFMMLFAWILFWWYFKLWMLPLSLIIPFLFYWASSRKHRKY
ncbi:hypothetical protein O3G_MSEX010988 [Manduca sexta]|uniref:C2 domain-containing protein n=1 Tax=Manduca sexta TaxID=7130 RepID=A0A921ZIZ1_MANSE|nr:hypothetical protein O3G_MSEX010988 [Manduca sexta]